MKPTEELRRSICQRPMGRQVVMYQKWRRLLFLHWEIEPQIIRDTLPPGLEVDTFEGRAYVGVVPFFMRDIRPRFCPTVPGISHFLELNVRTYVHDERGRPGVWFYSLDANQSLAVLLARRFFFLPYFNSKMSASVQNEVVTYASWRHGSEQKHLSSYIYSGTESIPLPEPGSLEFFLIERYLLFAYQEKRRRLYSGRVYHKPYSLLQAEVESYSSSPMELAGFAAPMRPPDHAIFSPGVDVDIFGIQAVDA